MSETVSIRISKESYEWLKEKAEKDSRTIRATIDLVIEAIKEK